MLQRSGMRLMYAILGSAAILSPALAAAQGTATAVICSQPRRIQSACAAGPDSVELLRSSARSLDAAGKPADALRALRTAAQREPERADLYLDIARISDRLGRRADAMEAYRRFVDLDPENPLGHELLAWFCVEIGEQDLALAEFQEAARLDPARPSPYHGEGVVFLAMGRDAEARRAFAQAALLERNAGHPATAENASPPQHPAPAGYTSSGSGFVVAPGGYILTNRHVVRGCGALRVRGDSGHSVGATVVALDSTADLALLRAGGGAGGPPWPAAIFRAGASPRPGDDVVALGYPLNGLLADQVNVTTGSINALAGMYNDERSLQMSAPVQPGSSGGPLLDHSGNVVGVVVTKLNAKVVADAMGDIPQNVNFAIKGRVARAFLDSQHVPYAEAPSTVARSNADVGDAGRRSTVLVECWR